MLTDLDSVSTSRSQIVETIWSIFAEAVPEPIETPTDARESLRLFGAGATLDSLGLVTLILDVEQQVNDQYDVFISLMDERALSQSKSPFRTIGTLADYVQLLLNEAYG